MGFKLLSPAAKVKPGVFRVSTIKSGRSENAPWRLLVSVPTAEFHLKFGDCDQFDISIGDGVDLGKLLIAPRPEGGGIQGDAAEELRAVSPAADGNHTGNGVPRRRPRAAHDRRWAGRHLAGLGLGARTMAADPRRPRSGAPAGRGCGRAQGVRP